MMREIRFRAWDKEKKSWVEAISIGSLIDTAFAFPDTVILEQFTGLYDKNGKEIYEGDIINFKYMELVGYRQPDGGETLEEDEDIGMIQWADGGWIITNCIGKYDNAPLNIVYDDSETIKIIGNIHQHPDLLK